MNLQVAVAQKEASLHFGFVDCKNHRRGKAQSSKLANGDRHSSFRIRTNLNGLSAEGGHYLKDTQAKLFSL